MTSLYSLRSTPSPGEFTITKFDEDYSVESLYALNASTCTCPQGHKPKCKHRRMLPLFLEHSHVDDGWFLDWNTRMWRHPIGQAEATAEQALADTALMGDAEHAEEIAKRMAPAFASEGSNAVLSERSEGRRSQPAETIPSEASGCEPTDVITAIDPTIPYIGPRDEPQAIPPGTPPKAGELRRRRI